MFCFAQEYSEVIEVPDKNPDQLYISAREWFAKTFVSSNDVLQMDDPVAGKLIGKGNTELTDSYTTAGMVKIPIFIAFKIDFTITVAVRDGRYKCDINNIQILQKVEDTAYNSDIKTPYSNYINDQEFYKNASDPNWLFANGDKSGIPMTKSTAKQMAPIYNCYSKLVVNIDDKMKGILLSLQQAMKTTEADW